MNRHLHPFNTLVIAVLLVVGLTTPAFGQSPSPQERPLAAVIPSWANLAQQLPAVTPEPPSSPTQEPLRFSLGPAPALQHTGPFTTSTSPSDDAGITNISGSTITGNDCYIPGSTATLCFTVYNASSDQEWLDETSLTFLSGWMVACNSQDAQDSGGNAISFDCAASDNHVTYTDGDGGYGEIYAGQSWGFCVDVTAPVGASDLQSVDWTLSGDEWANPPHDIDGTLDIDECLPLDLTPRALEIEGCAAVTQTHTFELSNNTGLNGTFSLIYAVPSGNGILSGPSNIVLNNGATTSFDVELTPDECLPQGVQVVATIEVWGKGYNDSSFITKTIGDELDGWQSMPSSAPPWADNGYPGDGCTAMNASGDWVTFLIGDQLDIVGLWGYNHATNAWFNPGAANTPTDRWAPDWAYDPETNLCYLTGGADAPGEGTYNEAYVYDPVTNAFAQQPNFATSRDFHDSWVGRIDGIKYLCVGGGVDPGARGLSSTQCYNLDASPANWEPENSIMGGYPTDIWGAADGTLHAPGGDQFWVVAGTQGSGISDAAHYFDDADNSWHSAGHTGQARFRLEGDFKDGDFYQLGGDTSTFNSTPTVVRGQYIGGAWVWEQIDDLPHRRMDNVVGVTIPEVSSVTPTIWSVDGFGPAETDHVDHLLLCPSCEETGWLEGHVMDAELGDTPPCTAAAVHIEPGGLDVAVDPTTGYYGPVELISYAYTLAASASGFSEETATVDVTTGMTTSQDLRLWRPAIGVTPTDLDSIVVFVGEEATYPLTIYNHGHLPLDFEIREIPPPTLLSINTATSRSHRQMPAATGVDSFIYEQFTAAPDGRTEFFIAFKNSADLTPAYHMNWSDRGRFVVEALQAAADAAQGKVKAWLDAQGIAYTSYWINNTLLVHADEPALNALATFPQVSGFMGNHVYKTMPQTTPPETSKEMPDNGILSPGYSWNIVFPGADRVHTDLNLRGEGIVIGGMDTGVDYDHIGLVQNYRGCLDPPACTAFDHTYSWHNPGDDECGGVPCDTETHGTATHGIMTGDDDPALPNGAWIGMAPNARWIHCLGLPDGSGTDAELNECAQWFLAPGGDPDMRPHIVNHSWGSWSPDSCDNWYAPALQAYRAADILATFAAGNVGDEVNPLHCSSSTSPANTVDGEGNPLAFASGAHGPDGLLDYYSSGGPNACNPDLLFPDLVAPGLGSCTTGLNDAYHCFFSGTSAASPHTAGCAALVRQADPWLTVAEVEQILREAANDVDDQCTGLNESAGWNNKYGEGHLDCYQAVDAVLARDLLWVQKDPISGTIPGLGEVDIDVTFHCPEKQTYTGTLRIYHNDPCQDPVDVPLKIHCMAPIEWKKWVNGNEWSPGISVTVETSDTITVVDVISYTHSLDLIETWNPDWLTLDSYQVSGGVVVTGTGVLTCTSSPGEPVTLTKTFYVESPTWTEAILWEKVFLGTVLLEQRPVLITKRLPDLWIDSHYEPQVTAGETVTFTLYYGNDGGYENDVWIRTEFPEKSSFVSSAPSPDRADTNDLWVEWDVGTLAMGDNGAIQVAVKITDDLAPATAIAIRGYIYNHAGEQGDSIDIIFLSPPSPFYLPLIMLNHPPP